MSRTEGEKISRQKYESKAYDQILLKVKKGKREEYKQAAAIRGLGQMEMIRLAIEKYIGEEFVPLPTTTPENKLSTEDKRLLDSAGKLTPEARKQLVKFLEILTARAATLDTKGGDEND